MKVDDVTDLTQSCTGHYLKSSSKNVGEINCVIPPKTTSVINSPDECDHESESTTRWEISINAFPEFKVKHLISYLVP